MSVFVVKRVGKTSRSSLPETELLGVDVAGAEIRRVRAKQQLITWVHISPGRQRASLTSTISPQTCSTSDHSMFLLCTCMQA